MMDKQNSAVKTLEDLGYTYNGGELWKPPIGKAPDFNLIDKLNARIKELEVEHQQTEMSLDEAKKYAWKKVVIDCGLSHATARELCNDHAFFNHGWNYATQYQYQTNKSKINEIKAQGIDEVIANVKYRYQEDYTPSDMIRLINKSYRAYANKIIRNNHE